MTLWFKRIQSIIWGLAALGTLAVLNLSLFRLLQLLASISSEQQPSVVYAFAFVELIRTFLSGWLLFTVFYRPGSRTLFPDAETREDSGEFFAMIIQFTFVSSCRLFLFESTARLFGIDSLLTNLEFAAAGIIAVILGSIITAIHLRRKKQQQRSLTQELDRLSNLSKLQSKAIRKLNENLNESEREELALLLYQSHQVNQATVQNLAKLAWYGLVIALLRETAEEILTRL